MFLSVMCLRSSNKAIVAAIFGLLLLSFRGALADPPVDPQCRVFCFRITDIRCDDDVENRYHFEFEVLNWSNAFAGGVRLALSSYSDIGVQFGGADVDAGGRPLVFEDLVGDGAASNFEDANGNGLLDAGEDFNGNARLDNDPIPGNLGRNNSWIVVSETPTSLEWSMDPDGDPDAIPFINLVGAQDCTKCIEGLPDRGGPQLVSIDADGNAQPVEYVDNGDNVQDGFVMTIDGLEPGRVAHINWFLLGAGGSRTDPEATPSGDCRVGEPDVDHGVPIGTVDGGNDYGFGLVSLYREADDSTTLPGGSFEGQTGFAQTPSEFFDGVYNVPPAKSGKFPQCGKFGMEFTPGTTCEQAHAVRESSCPPDVQLIPGQSTGVMPVVDGNVTDEEWAGAVVIPLYSHLSFPPDTTAYVKVNCVTNKWYVRTELNPSNTSNIFQRMPNSPHFHFVKLGITGQLEPMVMVDGNSRQQNIRDGSDEPHFRWVRGVIAKGKIARIGWEACFKWTGPGQPDMMQILTLSGNIDSPIPSTTLGPDPHTGLLPICACGGGPLRGTGQDGMCKPIETSCGGDPHFSTWSGQKFTFHGECDLVLIRNPAFAGGLGMHVHGRTKIHGGEEEGEGGGEGGGWSDMESVAIRIGGDVFEARGASEYWINGERGARLPALVGGYQVSLQQSNARRGRIAYVVHLGGEKEIRIKTLDEMMWVQIKGRQSSVFEGSDGLFGHYGNGRMMARDGTTVMEISDDYGQEWQVRPDLGDPALFHTVEGPQYPNKCKMPAVRSGNLRSSNNIKDAMDNNEGVLLAIAKKACAHAPELEMDDCIYDVVATQNVNVAEAY